MALVGSCSETESLKGFGARHRALGRTWQSEGGWQLVEEKQQREGSMVKKGGERKILSQSRRRQDGEPREGELGTDTVGASAVKGGGWRERGEIEAGTE